MQVNRSQRLPTQQQPLNILHSQPLKSNMRINSATRIMRHHHNLRMARQPRMHIGFRGMNIQPSPSKPPPIQRLQKRLIINQRPARDINKPPPLLELLQPLRGDKRLTRERRRNNHTIRIRQQLIQVTEKSRPNGLLLLRALAEEIVILDLHAQGGVHFARDRKPDLPHAYDAEGAAARVVCG